MRMRIEKNFIIIVTLLIRNSTAFGQSPEEEIKNTLIAMWDAIEQGDAKAYSEFIHPDFSSFGENDTYLSEGKRLEVQGIANWVARSENIHTEMHQPKITVRENTAWITYYWTDSGVTNGNGFSSRGKSTRIFVKEGGKWLCIHGHYTAVP